MGAKAITSRDNPLLVRLRKLAHDPTGYRRAGQVWLEGEHLCQAFVHKGGVAAQAVVTESGWQVPALRALADAAQAVAVVPDALMAGLTTLESPPALAFAIDAPGASAPQPGVATVVLDRLQDPGNVGTVLRSAAAFGFGQVVALKGTAALWSPKVMRAGMGAHFALRLVEEADAGALPQLQLPLLATSSHAHGGRSTRRRCRGPAPGSSATKGRASPKHCSQAAAWRCASRSPAARSR